MAFEWHQFLDVARKLQQEAVSSKNDTEAFQRSAVGRAYYAAFCHARNYAVRYLGYDIKGFGDHHGAVRAHLKKRRRNGDAARLDMLRQWRNEADYADDLPWDDPTAMVRDAITAAERVFASLTPPASSTGS